MILRYANLSQYPEYFRWSFPVPKNFDVIERIKEDQWVHDCDNCGSSTDYYVVVSDTDTKYYKVEHEWGWNWDDENDLYNDFEIKEVTAAELDAAATKNLRFVV